MPTYRIKISDDFERDLHIIASKKQLSSEELLQSLAEDGLSQKRHGNLTKVAIWISQSVLIAALTIVALAVISLPSIFLAIGNPPFPNVADRVLHWLRVFFQTMLPWPLTLIVLGWFFLPALARSEPCSTYLACFEDLNFSAQKLS